MYGSVSGWGFSGGAGSGRGSFYAGVTGWCPFMLSCTCTGGCRAIVGVMKHCFMFSFHGNSPQLVLVEGFTVSLGSCAFGCV